VAALPTGGFIAVWVSEQQRLPSAIISEPTVASAGEVSVDLYARIYNQDANPVGGEFLLNTDLLICANPAVAVAQDGRFVVAWSQGDPQNLTNSWDVYARPFSSMGLGGATVRINTRLPDSQFAPQLACLGNDFLAIWTSLNQDGSGHGVYGQFLTADAQLVGAEFRVNSTVLLNQNQPAIAADNFGRFFASWRTGVVNGQLAEEIAGQIYAPPGFEPLAQATNYVGPVFVSDGNSGDDVKEPSFIAGAPLLDFPVTPSGDQVLVDAFAQVKGAYNGLVFNTQGVRAHESGFVTALITGKAGYTVNLKIGAKTYAFSGKFDSQGLATYQKNRNAGAPIVVTLNLDMTGTDQLRGTFSDGEISTEFLADRAVYNASNPYPNPATYNVLIEPRESEFPAPQGSGHASMVVNKAGKVSFVGKLADGTAVTRNSPISKNGFYPLYAPLNQSRGCVLSWVQVSPESASGKVIWIKPAAPGKSYPAGFNVERDLVGSIYSRPVLGKRVLELPEGSAQIVFTGGGLTETVINAVYLDLNNRVVDASGSGIKATVSLPNGNFQGSFINPATQKRVQFNGKLLQGENYGAGFFLNNNLSGQVHFLSPLP
jgi:hypothetical protein